jgi:hypothetical protein
MAQVGSKGRVCCARYRCCEAALDAVRQWRFSPVRLNDPPVPVVMTVTVTFTLERRTNSNKHSN